MHAAITHPADVVAGLDSDEARRHIDVGADRIDEVLTRSRALTAVERLAIYSSSYYARLLECLREEFPVLKHALGEEAFDAFAVGYLQHYPPRSYTLARLGGEFPRYLAETRPEKEGSTDAPDWADFLIDLATLERTFGEVFDGPGVEGQTLLDAEQLAAVPAERWPDARLTPAPCLRLLALRFPAGDYYVAVRRDEEADFPGPAETFLAVTRRRYVCRHYPLSRAEHAVLGALTAGRTVAEAIGVAAEAAGPDLDGLAASLQAWFRRWAENGFFRGVEWADGSSPAAGRDTIPTPSPPARFPEKVDPP
jgi:hypothetical protein